MTIAHPDELITNIRRGHVLEINRIRFVVTNVLTDGDQRTFELRHWQSGEPADPWNVPSGFTKITILRIPEKPPWWQNNEPMPGIDPPT